MKKIANYKVKIACKFDYSDCSSTMSISWHEVKMVSVPMNIKNVYLFINQHFRDIRRYTSKIDVYVLEFEKVSEDVYLDVNNFMRLTNDSK